MSLKDTLRVTNVALEYITELRWLAAQALRLREIPVELPLESPFRSLYKDQLDLLSVHLQRIKPHAEELARDLSAIAEHGSEPNTPEGLSWVLKSAALEQAIESATKALAPNAPKRAGIF